MSETAIELYDPVKETSELKARVSSLEAQIGMIRGTIENQANVLRLVMAEALRRVATELDSGKPVEAGNPRVSAVWESWKRKLPGKRADFIQAMLEHGPMTGTQLRVATHTAAGSIAGIIHELKRLGLINKNGDRYSLKEL